MQDYPIKIGQMLFTMVDPNRGHEVAYNRWYERDHFYAGCMTGPGWFRFCVVRHPYDRFFSAWRDKIFITDGALGKISARLQK